MTPAVPELDYIKVFLIANTFSMRVFNKKSGGKKSGINKVFCAIYHKK